MRTATLERSRGPVGDGKDEQRLYRFDNGYGASVVRHQFSYGGLEGLWELAVLVFEGDGVEKSKLCRDTPVTPDVVGWLDDAGVDRLLDQIEALPVREIATT